MKYFIYCRKSTEEEKRQVQSLDTQESILKDFAEKNNLSIVEVIRESKSAKIDGNRPLFTSMLERIRLGEADGLLTAHVDRLSRIGIESGQLAKLVDTGVLKEIRTPDRIYSTYMDLMYIGFEFIFAEHYSRNLSVRVKEGIQNKLKNGIFPTIAPIGYLNKNKKIIQDETQVLLIQTAYKMYSVGDISLKELKKFLFERGFRTNRGKKIAKTTLHTILTNPFYTGLMRYHGVLYQGSHQPLISQGLFDKVQSVFKGLNRTKKQTLDFLYRPYLSCDVCGCRLTATRKKTVYDYYYCTNGRGNCSQHREYLPRARVQTRLQELLNSFSLPADLANKSFEVYSHDAMSAAAVESSTVTIIKNNLNTIDKKLEQLLDLLLDKKITQEQYDAKLKMLSQDKLILKNQLKNLRSQDNRTTLELVEGIKNKAISIGNDFYDGDDEVKGDILKGLLWNLKMKDGNISSVRYKYPFVYLQNLSKSSDLREWCC